LTVSSLRFRAMQMVVAGKSEVLVPLVPMVYARQLFVVKALSQE
jgi:hypothetical protein